MFPLLTSSPSPPSPSCCVVQCRVEGIEAPLQAFLGVRSHLLRPKIAGSQISYLNLGSKYRSFLSVVNKGLPEWPYLTHFQGQVNILGELPIQRERCLSALGVAVVENQR